MDGASADPKQRSKEVRGSLMNGLGLQFSAEDNQCPKNVASAADMLSDHKRDRRACQGNRQQKKSWRDNSKRGEGDSASSMTSSETSFAQGGKDQTRCC